MILDSSVFPLSTGGGGSASIAGFEWSEKTTDFTAVADKGYFCDTALNEILITLPTTPPNNTEIAFFLIGANRVKITTVDKVKNNFLATDYGIIATENYKIFVLIYNSATGWDWSASYTNLTTGYIGAGVELSFNSVGDTNGIIYYLGATKHNASFVNPVTRGEITSVVSSNSTPTYTNGNVKLYDRSTAVLADNCWVSAENSTPQTHTVSFVGKQAKITRFTLKGTPFHSPAINGAGCIFQASNDNSNWTNLLTFSASGSINSWWDSELFTNNSFYTHYRFYLPNTGYKIIGELEYYGQLS